MANRKGPAREAKVKMNYNETALQKAIDEKVEGAAVQAAPRKIRASAPRAPSTTKAKTISKTKPKAKGGKKVTSSRVTQAKTTSQTKPEAKGGKKAAPIKPAEKAITKGSSLEDHDSNTTSAGTKAVMEKSIKKAPPYSKPKTSSTTKKTDETTPLSDYDTNNSDTPRTTAAVENAIGESRKFTSINIAMPMPASPVPSLPPSSPMKSRSMAAPASSTKTRNSSMSPIPKRPSLAAAAAAAAAPTRTAVRKPRSPNMREQRIYLKPIWSLKRADAWERARKRSAEEKRKGAENAGAG